MPSVRVTPDQPLEVRSVDDTASEPSEEDLQEDDRKLGSAGDLDLKEMSTAEMMAAAVAAVEQSKKERRCSFSRSATVAGLAGVEAVGKLRRQLSSDTEERWGDGIPKSGHESLDYDEAEKDQLRAVAELPQGVGQKIAFRKKWATCALLLTIGLCVGTIAHLMALAIGEASDFKWDWVRKSTDAERYVEGWARLIAVCAPLALLAALLTYWAPDAAGSGIPYVKSYLNGNGLKLASFKTLVVKVVGISCCVTCGVPVGREGPMVHSGAVVAAVLTRVWAHVVHWHLRVPPGINHAGVTHSAQVQERMRRAAWTAGGYDNDRDRRNFVSMGAAAGVAAAFNAPIGGILFSLEEVSSFWDGELTVLTFLAAAVAAFTVNYWSSGMQGTFSDSGLVIFADGTETTYALWELIPFVLLGIVCGLLGALFNVMNKRMTLLRKTLLGSRPKLRVLEAVATVCLVVSVYYWVAYFWAVGVGCTDAPEFAGSAGSVGRRLSGAASISYQRHQCGAAASGEGGDGGDGGGSSGSSGGGGEMNEMATLLLQPAETAVAQLFSRGSAGYLSIPTLAFFVPLYFLSAAFTYGIAVPSGLFIPCMMMGAGLGRLCGELIRAMGNDAADPGVYALVGAAGMLGGVTRMTISLAVILVEVSNDIRLLLPIMLAILLARAVGDRFTHSLYDIHILLSGATLLAPAFSGADSTSYLLTARSLLGKDPLKTVFEAESVAALDELLRKTKHNAFPVVSEQSGLFAGLVGRNKLEALVAQAQHDRASKRYKIDLRPHYDHAPYTVHELLPLYRVSRLFMAMGLRHLCVLDGSSHAVGIITRKDLARIPTDHMGRDSQHLDASLHGGVVQKRMLDARHQASHAKAMANRRRGSDPGLGLVRTCSEPDVCSQTPINQPPDMSSLGRAASRNSASFCEESKAAMLAAQKKNPPKNQPSQAQLRLMKRRASV